MNILLPSNVEKIIQAIDMPCMFSKSVKYSRNSISPDRWLLTFPDFQHTQNIQISQIINIIVDFLVYDNIEKNPISQECRDVQQRLLNMATYFFESPSARCVHIGADESISGLIKKIYFEYDFPDSNIKFIALKYINNYLDQHHYIMGGAQEILARLTISNSAKKCLEEILSVTEREVLALEVLSNTTNRRSIDINLNGISFNPPLDHAITRLLEVVCSSDLARFPNRYLRPTHLAVGNDILGNDFVTLYGEAVWVTPKLETWPAQ